MKIRLAIAALALLAPVGLAHAQEEGVVTSAGYQVSETTVLHPDVSLESGYISNVFREEDNPNASGIARLIARIAIATNPPERLSFGGTPGREAAPQTIQFRLGAAAMFEQYLSGDERVRDQSNLAADVNARLVAFPQGRLSFVVEEMFQRSTQPRNFESDGSLSRDINRFLLGINGRPGGGALLFGLQYINLVDYFESEQSDFANRIQHTFAARSEWQVWPVTQLSLEASIGIFDQLGSSDGMITKVASNPLRVKLGAASLLTERTTLRSFIGYAKGFYESGPDYSSPIGGVEAGFRYAPAGRVTLGYSFDFHDSINANFFSDHAIVFGVHQQIRRVLVDATADLRFRKYDGVPMFIDERTERNDTIFSTLLRGRYVLRDWLLFSGTFQYIVDDTNFTYTVGDSEPDDPSFERFEVTAGLTAAF